MELRDVELRNVYNNPPFLDAQKKRQIEKMARCFSVEEKSVILAPYKNHYWCVCKGFKKIKSARLKGEKTIKALTLLNI